MVAPCRLGSGTAGCPGLRRVVLAGAVAALLRREFHGLARDAGGWSEGEANSRMGTVFQRAAAAAAGQRVEWNGGMVDPRYRLRAATMIEWLEVTPAEMRAANLRVLRDREVGRERERARSRVRRAAAGGQDRAAYTAPAQERRGRVAGLRREGQTWRAIGLALGISEGEARRLAQAAPAGTPA